MNEQEKKDYLARLWQVLQAQKIAIARRMANAKSLDEKLDWILLQNRNDIMIELHQNLSD